ncbi:MAG: 16S rRNA (cytidine(1402)-2'-O)-methyltransferase, partial [Acidimicrobiales bacterium]
GGDRRVAVARELTKVHEEVWRGTLTEALARAREKAPRGEHVIVVDGAPQDAPPPDDEVQSALAAKIDAGRPRRDAIASVAAELGVPKRRAYELAVRMRAQPGAR